MTPREKMEYLLAIAKAYNPSVPFRIVSIESEEYSTVKSLIEENMLIGKVVLNTDFVDKQNYNSYKLLKVLSKPEIVLCQIIRSGKYSYGLMKVKEGKLHTADYLALFRSAKFKSNPT